MAKKDTTESVLAMLGTRGPSFRPSGDLAPAPRTEQVIEERELAPRAEAVVPPATAAAKTATTARRARKQLPKSSPAPDPEENAPRTLRLSQPMANSLRNAWLAAKREDVLLTYQDFADQVVRAGLRRR